MLTSITDNRRSLARWYGMAIAGGMACALLIANPAIRPVWVLFGLLLLVVLLEGMLKFPAAMLVPVIFIPQWKDQSFLAGFQSRVDLTVVSLIILCITVLLNSVGPLARGRAIKEVFAGQGKGIIAFFSFAVIVALSYLYTPAPNWGFTQVSRLFGIGGLLFLSPFILVKEEKDFRAFAIAFVVFAMPLAAQMIFMPRYSVTVWGWTYGVKTDIGGGWLLGMAILLLFYYPFTRSSSSKWILMLLCGPLLLGGLVASTARGPLVSLVFAFLVTPLVLSRTRGARAKVRTTLVVLLLLVTSMVAAYSLLPWMGGKFQEKTRELERIAQGSWPGGTAGERLVFYKAALKEITERPVLGLGVGGWSVYFYGDDARGYPHNLLLLIAAEQGLVGVTALGVFLWIVALTLKRILAATGDRYAVLFALVLFSVTVGMFSGDLDMNRLLWLWCGMSFVFARMLSLTAGTPQTFQPRPNSERWSPRYAKSSTRSYAGTLG